MKPGAGAYSAIEILFVAHVLTFQCVERGLLDSFCLFFFPPFCGSRTLLPGDLPSTYVIIVPSLSLSLSLLNILFNVATIKGQDGTTDSAL